METATDTKNTGQPIDGSRLQVLGELLGRAMLMSRLGTDTYGGNRDIYTALGYPKQLQFADYLARYVRQDIAKAIIDRPVKATWQGPLELIESERAEDTEFEKSWQKLNRDLGIKSILSRVDRLTGIGRYGVLLLGLDDVTDKEGFKRPVKSGPRKLIYLKPFSEDTAKILTYEADPKNKRYGMPLLYDVQVADASSGNSMSVQVHHSRIIHIVDGNLESEILGVPRLEVVYNRLIDLEKLVGGSAEMFWRGARPGYQGKVDKDYTMTEETKADLTDQLTDFENDLKRFLINEGVDIKALDQQISDPSNHMDVLLTLVSAVTGIPKRILSGSERGQLASTQDTMEWLSYVQGRREDHAEPKIIRPMVDRFIELQILPKPPKDYTVKWQDLFSISEKDRVEIGRSRATAISEYTKNPIAQGIFPPTAFFRYGLGLMPDEITEIEAVVKAEIGEELADFIKAMLKDNMNPAPANEGAVSGKEVVKKVSANGEE